ncbi:hypothetical protein ACP70R_004591 [Stipagrostis hirtigluma subsp. patula]
MAKQPRSPSAKAGRPRGAKRPCPAAELTSDDEAAFLLACGWAGLTYVRAGGSDRRARALERRGRLRPLPRRVPRVAPLRRGPAGLLPAGPPLPPPPVDHAAGGRPARRRHTPPPPLPERLHRRVRHDGPPGARRPPPAWRRRRGPPRPAQHVHMRGPSSEPAHAKDQHLRHRTHTLVSGLGLADDAMVALCFGYPNLLVVAKPGDDRWTPVIDSDGSRRHSVFSATSFSGRFYCASRTAIMVLEAATADQPPRLAVVAETIKRRNMLMTMALVENDGKLLLLHRLSDGDGIKYHAYQVDLDARMTVPIHDLGRRAVFLGMRHALSVCPNVFPSIRASTIYLGFDCPERFTGNRISSYNLLTGRSECSNFRWGDAMTQPCGIGDYLSWYVSGVCSNVEEI